MTETDVRDSRSCERFVITPPLEGSFAGWEIVIVDLAQLGVRIEHASPMKLGMKGLIIFRIPGLDEIIRHQAEVVWSRLSKKTTADGKLLYRSGLRFMQTDNEIAKGIEVLITADKARPDEYSLEKKKIKEITQPKQRGTSKMKVIRQHRRIDEDTLLLVKQAWNYMKHNPVEANKWYNRAKYSLKDRDQDQPTLHHKDDVLAIWEYLERMIQLETIDWILDNEHIV